MRCANLGRQRGTSKKTALGLAHACDQISVLGMRDHREAAGEAARTRAAAAVVGYRRRRRRRRRCRLPSSSAKSIRVQRNPG
jgi:hypothetical protein